MAMEPISPNLPTDHNLDVNAMLGGRPHLELVHDLDVVEEIAQPYYFNDNDELVVPEGQPAILELVPDVEQPEVVAELGQIGLWGKLKEKWQGTKTGLEMGVVAAEISPANEVLRFGAFGLAQAKGLDPLGVAAVYAGATAAIEGLAAYAATDLLHNERGKKVTAKLSELTMKGLKKVGFKGDSIHLNGGIKAGTGLFGGSAVLLLAKNIEEPERTKEQDKRTGKLTVAALTGFCAIQGYLMSKAIETPSAQTIGAGLVALGGTFAGAGYLKHRIEKQEATFDSVEDQSVVALEA